MLSIILLAFLGQDPGVFIDGYDPVIENKPFCRIQAPREVHQYLTEFDLDDSILTISSTLDFSDSLAGADLEAGYEAVLGAVVQSLVEGKYVSRCNKAIHIAESYLLANPDSVPVPYGGALRAWLMYNYADAVYYSSYNPRGEVRNIKRHQDAFDVYQDILETYPHSPASDFTRVSMTWFKLENYRYREAIADFENIFDESPINDVRVLASYGNALSNYYGKNYEMAGSWFLSEEDYSYMGLTVDRADRSPELAYSEIADSLISRNLFRRGMCYEKLGAFGDAVDTYKDIVKTYPDRVQAGESARKVVEIYLRAAELTQAEDYLEKVKKLHADYPPVYSDAYAYSLAAVYDYHVNVMGNDSIAEVYAKRMVDEMGTSRPLEELYYRQAMQDTSVASIPALRSKIEIIKHYNPESIYMPEPMYNLAYLLYMTEKFDESEQVLLELKNWPDRSDVRDLMPDISYQLVRTYFEQERYQDAVDESLWWIGRYEEGEDARPDLAPYVYWWLGWSYYTMAEEDADTAVRIEHYRKAREAFVVLKEKYEYSEFTESVSQEIEQLLDRCKDRIKELE